MVRNCSLFFLSVWVYYSPRLHIFPETEVSIKTLYIYYMMMRDTEMKIDSPKINKPALDECFGLCFSSGNISSLKTKYNKCCSESKSIFVNK